MARTWMILSRVVRVVLAEAQAGMELAAVGEEQAEHAAAQALAAGAAAAAQAEVAAARAELEETVVHVDAVPAADAAGANNLGQPGFTFSVEPPPRVTFVTARPNALPDDLTTDMYPYIVASGSFCMLAHFATAPYSGTDLRRLIVGARNFPHHLIVVRYFRKVGGEIAATALRVPARPRNVSALKNIESIGLVCDGYTGPNNRRRTYKYRIAELVVDTGRTNPSLELAVFRSDRSRWFAIPDLKSPLLDWNPYRRWVPHGTVAVDNTVVWFDLSWGLLCCDIEQEEPEDFEVQFYRLPRHRALPRGEAMDDIHTKRCIAVGTDMLWYVEIIIPDGEAARVCMWSLAMGAGGDGWRWIANFSVSFQDIWNNQSYALAGLQPEVPVLVGVCPANSNVIYFELHHRLFGVNVPECRVVDYEAIEHELVNVPGPGAPQPQTGSSRYLLTWNLLRPGRAPILGHVSPDLPDDGFPDDPKDEDPQDPKGKSKATGGQRKSSSASSSRPSKALRIK